MIMCGSNDPQLNLCYKEQHEDTITTTSHSSSSVETVWKETQQLMEDCEQLVRIMTHVCSQQFSGVYRTLARYSQGCWRGCSADESPGEGYRHGSCQYVHPSLSHQPSCFASSCQEMSSSCEGCVTSGCNNPYHTSYLKQQQQHHHLHEESMASATCSSCRWRGGWGRRWRWRWGRYQGAHCHQSYCTCTVKDRGSCGVGSLLSSSSTSSSATKYTNIVITNNNHHYPPCPTQASTSIPSTCTHASSSSPPPSPLQSTAAPTTPSASPKSRSGVPSHPSLLTLLLLLVVTLARFTDGCSSRSTPKPRPASPTMRPNITFQTYACPPAYAAWYCLNGATCFTVKIGESILYNCECADGYMGQRCEFKDLDGSYLPAREKVLLETASIAGGATVACVLVFIVLFAVYIFMQKDKDKRCRDVDGGRDNDRQPFSGYQNSRPEIFRTISNPYARNIDELSHVEVQPGGHGNITGSGRNIISSSGGGNTGGSMADSGIQGAQQLS